VLWSLTLNCIILKKKLAAGRVKIEALYWLVAIDKSAGRLRYEQMMAKGKIFERVGRRVEKDIERCRYAFFF
jgi:hypothetical protein